MDHPRESSTRLRHYRCVSWHSSSKLWVVTIKGQYQGCVGDEDSAADIAAKSLGLRHRDKLRLDAKLEGAEPEAQTSRYRYVTFSLPRKMWFAQRRGEFLGQFNSDTEAAKAVIQAGWAATLQELRASRQQLPKAKATAKSRAQGKPKVIKKAQVIKKAPAPGKLTRGRVRDLWLIYRDAAGGKGKAALPDDLQDNIQILCSCLDTWQLWQCVGVDVTNIMVCMHIMTSLWLWAWLFMHKQSAW